MARSSKYTNEARQVLTFAREEARRLRHRLVGTEHLLLGILRLKDPVVEALFASMQVRSHSVLQALDFVIGRGNKALLSEPSFSATAREVLVRAEEEAARTQSELVGVEHILLAIFSESGSVAIGVLESFGMNITSVRQQLEMLMVGGRESLLYSVRYQLLCDMTPTLNQVSRDLTLAALSGSLDPMIGREMELERTMQILTRRTKNNPVLIGPAGVGKTAIAEALALRIIQGQVPDILLHRRVVALDVGLLTIGTKFRGDFEERLKRIMQEILESPGIIIVIDELHSLVQTGVAEGSLDASNLFKPMLARGEFQCIGATTLDKYRKTIEADPALERRFQPIQVMETNARETLEVLEGLRARYEDFHHVTISDAALVAAVQMSTRYIPNRCQPDKALDLIDEAASRASVLRSVAPEPVHQLRNEIVRAQSEKEHAIVQRDFSQAAALFKRERQLRQDLIREEYEWYTHYQQESPTIGLWDIARVVAAWTGVPVMRLAEDEAQRLLHLEDTLHRRIIGQDEAVQAVARAIRRSYANVRDSKRPIGSFIFVGPTGVGKTELGRSLAEVLFGNEDALLKFDMSEFAESHHVSRLIGTAPGYIGYDQGGQLTEMVRRRPYSVVLFDEVEKAHPNIFDLLLQILEDGCLTDSHGQKVDFRNTMIILTSNVGTMQILSDKKMSFTLRSDEKKQLIESYEHMRELILQALKSQFRPELLNRVDEIIVFHALRLEHLHQIVNLLIKCTQQRLAEQSIALQITEAMRLLLVKRGYHPEYGVRPLRRTVQTLLEDMLADAILSGSLTQGDSVIVDVCDDEPCLSVYKPDHPSPDRVWHSFGNLAL
ncbi:MAG TPA: ATP-dependent Clp protease ATP-binding subunit [Ktedonosporobacter sp.]|jgi:ATP-dependent Clp protease ATP-binding subunit ClpC|nr:ATP-dependent Clp protease ATP-binding subunit [Ktedonosporobacter sp.]